MLAGPDSGWPPPDLRGLLVQGASEARATLEALSRVPLAPVIADGYTTRLRVHVTRVRELLQGELVVLDSRHDDDTSAAAMEASGTPDDEEQLLGNVLQDRYFQIRRVPGLTWRQLAAQVFSTAEGVLLDLPYTRIDVDEPFAVFQALAGMWMLLAGADGQNNDDLTPAPIPDGQLDEVWQRAWLSINDAESFGRMVARYRWITGHHLFDLCFIFCRRSMLAAVQALHAGDLERAGRELQWASVFLRGTTAAMRYAGNFPARIYNEVTRPSMDAMGKPLSMGFSGTQNSDYIKFQAARDILIREVGQRDELLAAPAYEPVLRGLQDFRETYLSDMEQHILIAASKVNTDTSLMQKATRQSLPASFAMAHKSGTDVLRDLAARRRKELRW